MNLDIHQDAASTRHKAWYSTPRVPGTVAYRDFHFRAPSPVLMAPTVSELHAAVRAGHADEIRKALAGGASVESAEQETQQTLLHTAALAGNVEIAQLLLDAGAKSSPPASLVHAPTGLTVTGATPLHFASSVAHSLGHLAVVKLLLSRGGDVHSVTGKGGSPLQAAADNGNAAACRLLVAAGADINAAVMSGATPLHAAAAHGDVSTVAALLELGADATAKDRNGGETALHAASRLGRTGAAAVLILKAKSDVMARATFVMDNGHAVHNSTCLHLAASFGHDGVMAMLLQAGAEAAAESEGGFTPLHAASYNGHASCVALLLAMGVSPALTTSAGGYQPLHSASMAGQVATGALLLDAGAHIDAATSSGDTALMLAAAGGHVAAVQALLARGANKDTVNAEGATAKSKASEACISLL